MKLKITLWVFVILCCIALGLWQRENLSIVWREYSSLWQDYDYHEYCLVPRKPLIPEIIARDDPEAATIAERILGYHEQDERLLSIAEGLAKYPRNEFLLGQFASFISDNSAYEPNLRLRAAKRLVSLNPEKPFYHYFLADALLACGNDINLVLNAVEHGNRCSDYNNPYDEYKQRVIDVMEKAKLSRMDIRHLDYERMEPSPSCLDRKLISFAAASFADGDNLVGTRICDAVYEMQRKRVLTRDLRAIALNNLNLMSSPISFGHWYNPEGLELQRVELSKERARKDRLRLCARIPESILSDSEKPYVRPQTEIKNERKADSAIIAIMLAPYSGRMFVSVGLAILILALFCLADGYVKNEKVGIVKTLMFAFACLVFFLVARGIFVQLALGDICCCSSYTEMLHPPKIGLNALRYEPILAVIFLAVPVAGLLFLQISRKSRWWIRAIFLAAVTAGCFGFMLLAEYLESEQLFLEDLIEPIIIVIVIIIVFAEVVLTIIARWLSKWKIVWLAAAASLFGSLSIAAQGYFYLEFLVMLLFILFSATTIVGPSPKDKSPIVSLLTLFGTDTQQVSIRVGCLKLVAPFIIVYWLIFVGLMPASAYRINYEVNQDIPAKRKYTLPEPNEATYHRVLNYLESKQGTRTGIFKLLGLVMPEDLPGVLENFKELPSNDYYGEMKFRPSLPGEPNRPAKPNRTNDPNRTKDILLTRAIITSGRDAVNILTAAITNPNHQQTLIARAKLGDVTAKQPLEELLASRISEGNDFPCPDDNTNPWDKPVKSEEIIPALACVSEPNEAAQRYISYIQRRSMPEILEDIYLVRSVNLLPSRQARVVIKSYLAKSADWQPPTQSQWGPNLYSALIPLRELVGYYGDREIAEGVFRLMLRVDETGEKFEVSSVSRYFTIESADLLKKGLTARNGKFRAWSVWQLRKVGYKFSQEDIDKLLKDDSWMVRANVVMAEPQIAKNIAMNDKNSFVRFIAILYADTP